MTLPTTINDLFGIRRPVLQAPMANVATPELAAAVSEAGGLGALGSAVLPPDELHRQTERLRTLTDAPFNLNFFAHAPPQIDAGQGSTARERAAALYEELGMDGPPQPSVPPIHFDAERLEAVLEIEPAVVSFHFGLPGAGAVAAIRERGTRVIATATTVAEAVALEATGVDAVIAQGSEAGGHRGSFLVPGDDGPIGTLALVPQAVDAVQVPVIAAGGVADGRGLAAVFALGAAAAQLGTAFLACPEASVHPAHRDAVREISAERTTITRAFSGRPARAVRNRVSDALGSDALEFPAQLSLTGPLADNPGDPGAARPLWLGQAASLTRERPAAELVESLFEEAAAVLAELSPRA